MAEPFESDYDHLNKSDPLTIALDLDVLAGQIVSMNYGTARFLAALVRARRRSEKFKQPDKIADTIQSLLEQGLH